MHRECTPSGSSLEVFCAILEALAPCKELASTIPEVRGEHGRDIIESLTETYAACQNMLPLRSPNLNPQPPLPTTHSRHLAFTFVIFKFTVFASIQKQDVVVGK